MYYTVLFTLAAFVAYSSQTVPHCPARDGAQPTYIPHDDCTKFYECSNGEPYLFDCPAGLHFNPDKNVCDWPQDAGCRRATE
ncbi:hypothetical protein Zmor_011556 [Zophobas morio]|uniref:Chitin-binding type-2 domain-containing protein n=1 Tax=Zophobas morio TaxID=2755281 RepID=A0AA38IV99_9CUCU|nr:hypothetical protein Zmor_011556 [Zophobas morio]